MPLQKLCSKCRVEKPASDFYANKRMTSGLSSYCVICHKKNGANTKKITRSDPIFKTKELAYKKEYRARTVEKRKEYMQQWHKKNKEAQLEYLKQYRLDNKEYFTQYSKDNRSRILAHTRKRQASLLQRTPPWLDRVSFAEMEFTYEYCGALRSIGLKYEVDHIVPLQGKVVSGLHVPWNLQVISEFDNRSKANNFPVNAPTGA